ncbi:uncharacterized protein TNCV_4541451 [Trichonephila clavipes]|nr:uncharacterized protein TNCV_4541451 [Trichonephila clavipes]
MNAAVYEAVIANDNNSNIAVAVDGTWHKRGYSSLNGVVCATSVERTERLSTLKLLQNIVLHLSDGKNISGRGRLTLKEVDSIQHYYGLAIRKNLSSVEDMKRAIWAIYFHKLNTEDNPQHALCPLGEDSWHLVSSSLVHNSKYVGLIVFSTSFDKPLYFSFGFCHKTVLSGSSTNYLFRWDTAHASVSRHLMSNETKPQ